jgi:aspartate aminotransferase
MIEFSENVASLQPSATMAVSTRVKQLIAQGRDILDLCVGEPDFPTPAFVAEAGVRAIQQGRTRYTPAPGVPDLRAAIAQELQRYAGEGQEIGAHGVVVTAGAKQALFNACFSLFGPGDRVVIPVPYWTTYPALVEIARAEPVYVKGSVENDFKVTPAELDRVYDGRVRGLMLNSPSNPSGAVYSHEELRAIAEWAKERKVWILCDEIYRRIYFKGQLAPGLLDLPPELTERSVVIDGASKAFAMTGWRIGFTYTSRELAEKMSALQSQMTSNAATPSQYAALAAYRADESQLQVVEEMRRTFERRRDLLVSEFGEKLPEVSYLRPEGAFYFWFNFRALAREDESSIAFCERLLNEAGVGLVPGAAFGDDDFVRMSFAYDDQTLREAVTRLARLAQPVG